MTDSKQWEKELEKIKKEVYYEIPTMGRGGEYVSRFLMWNMLEIKLLPFITSAINQAVAEEKTKTKKIVDDVKDNLWKIQRMGVIDFKGEKLEVITRYQALNTINLSGLPYTSSSEKKLTKKD